MYAGFPVEVLRLVTCPADEGVLSVADGSAAKGTVSDGAVRCARCRREYPVRGGILKLLDEKALDGESTHELQLREAAAPGYDDDMRTVHAFDLMERLPTLATIDPQREHVLLELGCGTGRFTVELARACGTVLALDFSEASLRVLATKLDASSHIGLVQADVTRFAVARGAFDLVVSTLVSNLPTHTHREALYRLAARALREGGRFVFSTHSYTVRERLRRMSKDGRYDEGGIYRRLFTRRDVDDEVRPHFGSLESRPIQIAFPLTKRLGLPLLPISRVAERIPIVRRLGSLLLVTARAPRAR